MKRIRLAIGILLVAVAVIGTFRQWFPFIVGGILAFIGSMGFGIYERIEIGRSDEETERRLQGDTPPMSPYSDSPLGLKEPTRHEAETEAAAKPMKKAGDCDCACHRGAVIVHVVACCEAPVAILRIPPTPPSKQPK